MPANINSPESTANQVFNIKDCLKQIGIKEISDNIYEVPNFIRKKKALKNRKLSIY
jgi:hypothetical protein